MEQRHPSAKDHLEATDPGVAPGSAALSDRMPDLRTTLLVVIAVVLVGWVLRAMAVVLIPVIASILIALAVMPVRDHVQARVSRRWQWLGTTAAMAVILLILVGFFAGIWIAAQRLLAELPAPPAQIVEQLQDGGLTSGEAFEGARAGARAAGDANLAGPALQEGVADSEGAGQDGASGLLPGSIDNAVGLTWERVAGAASGIAVTILNSALGLVAGLVLIFFFTLLILIESRDWHEKFRTITKRQTTWQLTESTQVIAGKLRHYLVVRTVMGVVTAALYATWLWFFGAGLILVWALLTFLLNFVPTVGSLVAGILPFIYVVVTEGWWTAFLVGAGLLVIEQIMGNYVDPRVQGNQIALSPLVILVSLLFWGWIWGIPGALLAVPVTVALVVLASHVTALRPWALLLTDKTTLQELDEVTRPE